jgi:hypothetical protein
VSTVSQITQELRARYLAFRARGLGEVELLVLFCDAIYLWTSSAPGCRAGAASRGRSRLVRRNVR